MYLQDFNVLETRYLQVPEGIAQADWDQLKSSSPEAIAQAVVNIIAAVLPSEGQQPMRKTSKRAGRLVGKASAKRHSSHVTRARSKESKRKRGPFSLTKESSLKDLFEDDVYNDTQDITDVTL